MNTGYNYSFFFSSLDNILFTSQNTQEIILTAAKLIFLSLVAEHEHILIVFQLLFFYWSKEITNLHKKLVMSFLKRSKRSRKSAFPLIFNQFLTNVRSIMRNLFAYNSLMRTRIVIWFWKIQVQIVVMAVINTMQLFPYTIESFWTTWYWWEPSLVKPNLNSDILLSI